jgi:hypothetical protein
VFDPEDPSSGLVTARPIAAAAVGFQVPVAQGQVVDLVVAVAPATAVPDAGAAPTTTFTVVATLTP